MSKKKPAKDDALEALDFVINVLREHEKDLDRLTNELASITDKLGGTELIGGKIDNVESKLNTLQIEIANLLSRLSTSTETKTPEQVLPVQKIPEYGGIKSPPVILRCKQWDDFKNLAYECQTLSFLYKETEKTFQVDALKSNQIISYSGELPKETALLKIWLSTNLAVPEKRILEGILVIG